MKKTLLFAAAVSLFLATGSPVTTANAAPASPAELDVATEPAAKALSVRAGLGLASVPDYEGSKDHKIVPALMLTVGATNGMSAELMGNTLRANIVPSNTWRFGPLLRYRADRRNVENEKVDKMEIIDAATELGAFAGLDIDKWSFRVDATHDTSGVYNGTVGSASVGYTWLINPWRLTLSGFADIADDNYMQTYFGVNAKDSAKSGLRQYNANGGIKDVGAALLAGYRIDQNWGVTCALRYAQLLGDAADSPVVQDVGSPAQIVFGVLASYSF